MATTPDLDTDEPTGTSSGAAAGIPDEVKIAVGGDPAMIGLPVAFTALFALALTLTGTL